MRIVVTDANLLPHRERFEAALPADAEVRWRVGADPAALLADLRDAEVYVGGRFTADMADVAEKLRLVHVVGAGTDRVDFTALPDDVLVANTFHHERSIAEYVLAASDHARPGLSRPGPGAAQRRLGDVGLRRHDLTTAHHGGLSASASSDSVTSASWRGSCCAASDVSAPR